MSRSYVWKKVKENIQFIVPLVLIFAGYVFFFTSKFWMPLGSNVSYFTKTGYTQEWNNRDVKLIRWEYCESSGTMEIELDIKNNSFDGRNKYIVSATDINEGYIDISKVVEEPDWIIVKLSNIPKRWSEISLRLAMNEVDEEPCKVYTNIKKVTYVDKLGQEDINGYRINRFNLEIKTYQEDINKLNSQIEEKNKSTANINEEINRLNREKIYQTEAQKQETDATINTARSQINSNNEAIQEMNEEIAEINRRIEKVNEKIKEINGSGG